MIKHTETTRLIHALELNWEMRTGKHLNSNVIIRVQDNDSGFEKWLSFYNYNEEYIYIFSKCGELRKVV